MAEIIELKVENRDVTGKKVKFLRRKGVVPVHLFGHNIPSKVFQGEAVMLGKAIAQAGRTRLINLKVEAENQNHVVMVKEVQKDAIKGDILHVDFYEVNMAEKIKVEVPIALVGESPALKIRENMMYQNLNTLHIECLPDKMPDKIEIDISVITDVDQAIHVKDVVLPDINILNDSDVQIVKVALRPVEVVEEKGRPAEAAEKGAEAKAAPKAEAKK